MKKLSLLLLLLSALLLNGCGSSTPTAQSATGGLWSAVLNQGEGSASGFSFITQFTVASSGTLSFSSFQFINQGNCFPLDGGTISGNMTLTENMATDEVSGNMTLTVTSSGNTLTLTSDTNGVTGTLTGTTLSNGMVTGSWSVTGATGCTGGNGSFTMTSETATKT
jgi:hypothetical protein